MRSLRAACRRYAMRCKNWAGRKPATYGSRFAFRTEIPIAAAHVPYLQQVAARLREHGIRVEVDDSDDRMQKKIRTAQRQKVPYMLLAGDDDVAAGAVSFRYRSGEQKNGVPVAQAVAEITAAVADRIQV